MNKHQILSKASNFHKNIFSHISGQLFTMYTLIYIGWIGLIRFGIRM